MMQNTIITSILLFFLFGIIHKASGQTRAVTADGDTIYVYKNGTWSFEPNDVAPKVNDLDFLSTELKIDTVSNSFQTPPSANKELENTYGQFKIKYNNDLWKRLPPGQLNEEAEFALKSKITDIWCVVISEETSIKKDKLFLIAKNTMEESTGSEAEILEAQIRTVNGTEILKGVLRADFSDIIFIFQSYYYSDEIGSVQFITWTSENVWQKNRKIIDDLLNGFVIGN